MSREIQLPAGPGDVAAWRRDRLLAAGFDAAVSSDFAHDSTIDLHDLLDLVDRGCPPGLAARIRAPLDHRGRPA
jgi:hypothetical protein